MDSDGSCSPPPSVPARRRCWSCRDGAWRLADASGDPSLIRSMPWKIASAVVARERCRDGSADATDDAGAIDDADADADAPAAAKASEEGDEAWPLLDGVIARRRWGCSVCCGATRRGSVVEAEDDGTVLLSSLAAGTDGGCAEFAVEESSVDSPSSAPSLPTLLSATGLPLRFEPPRLTDDAALRVAPLPSPSRTPSVLLASSSLAAMLHPVTILTNTDILVRSESKS